MRVSPSPLSYWKRPKKPQKTTKPEKSPKPQPKQNVRKNSPIMRKSRHLLPRYRMAKAERCVPGRAGSLPARLPGPGRALPGKLHRYFLLYLIHLLKCLADVLNPAVRALHGRLHNGPDSVMKQEIITSAFSASIFQIVFIIIFFPPFLPFLTFRSEQRNPSFPLILNWITW